ncbi:MAG TPA: hypothetical protein PKY82_12770 [Pyrinomonadaceae bacterium]|nr:hypothetical protein [Pyrinomonadaceae bacterium]
MKKSLGLIFASLVVVGGTALVSFGQQENNHKPPTINEREHNQRERIKDGVQDGDISKPELKRLAKEQAQIRQMERRARSDGDVTARERARLQRELSQSSRHIRRASRN